MSGQLIELIIFAGIAFFIINKLISTLGSTSEDDKKQKNSSVFQNKAYGMKDVTNSIQKNSSSLKSKFSKSDNLSQLQEFVIKGHEQEIMKGLATLVAKLPSFSIEKFLNGAKVAFKMIVESGTKTNQEVPVEELVDKRYLEHFSSMVESYGMYSKNKITLIAQVAEIYMFGNNAFVKILFTGKGITSKIKNLHEEWTFSRSTLDKGNEWYLTNIDRPQ